MYLQVKNKQKNATLMNHGKPDEPDPPPFIPLVRGVNLPSFGPC